MSCFTDVNLVLPLLKNPIDRIRFLRILLRSQALEVSLKVNHGEDIQPLVRYWGRFGREEIIEQHLEMLRNLPQGGEIDIIHLLPPIPRSRLNTYMMQPEIDDKKLRDCGWVMFNFFNNTPDDRFDVVANRSGLAEAISKVPSHPEQLQFGDILHFVNKDGIAVHTCVHIADGIVFTKNGIAPQYPFKFDYLENVIEFYSLFEDIRIIARERVVAQTQSVVSSAQ